MLLAEPPPTQGDIHFRLCGFPVRISPLFWVTTAILGISGNRDRGTPPAELLIWIGVVFVSILVHELGHAFMQRRFGGRPWITLHGIGGLASCDDCDRSPRSQILISLAGPAAGFLFALAVLALLRISGRAVGFARTEETLAGVLGIPILGGRVYWEPLASMTGNILVTNILWVNIMWGLINLLPVYPLDGGQVSRELCTLRNPRQGIFLSLQISIAAAALMAAYGLFVWQSFITALMFGYLAYINYRTLQAYQSSRW